MGVLSEHLVAIIGNDIVSVHAGHDFDTNLLSVSGGSIAYVLKINGEECDAHTHGMFPKSGVLFGVIESDDQKRSVRVDVKPKLTGVSFSLIVDGDDVPLDKSSEADIKELLHKRALKPS